MPNYAVTCYDTDPQSSVGEAVQLLETYIETVGATKTIISMSVIPLGRDREKCVGYCIHIT